MCAYEIANPDITRHTIYHNWRECWVSSTIRIINIPWKYNMHLFLIIQYKVSVFFCLMLAVSSLFSIFWFNTGVFIRSIKQIFLTLARQREMKIYANVCKLLSTNVAKTRSFRVFFCMVGQTYVRIGNIIYLRNGWVI